MEIADWPQVVSTDLIHCCVRAHSLQAKGKLRLACGQYNPESKSSRYKCSRKALGTLRPVYEIYRMYSPFRKSRPGMRSLIHEG
jgi:hypothetical protein